MSSKIKPLPEKNEKGHYYMTEKFVTEYCEYNGYYSVPRLNENLHLHYRGFQKIENLNAFINVKVLYLENNCINKIENISHMKNLTFLYRIILIYRYLHNNFIETIENLDENTQLSTLNLASNKIKKISGLDKLAKLSNLYLEKNLIDTVEGIRPVLECPSIAVVILNIFNI